LIYGSAVARPHFILNQKEFLCLASSLKLF